MERNAPHIPAQWLMATDKSLVVSEAAELAVRLYGDLSFPWVDRLGRVYENYFRESFSQRLSECVSNGGMPPEDAERADAQDSQLDLVSMINMVTDHAEEQEGIYFGGPITAQIKCWKWC